MNLILKLRSRKLFITLFLSFLLFILIPVAVFFSAFYYDMIGYYEEAVSDSTLSKLTIVQNTIDGKFEELEREAIQISTDPSLDFDILNHNANVGTPKDADSLLKVKKICDILNNIKSINPSIQSVYIYNRDSNLVLNSNEGIYNFDQFPDKDWVEQYSKANQKKLLIGSRMVSQFSWDKDPKPNVVTIVCPFTAYTQMMNGSIAINILGDSLYPFINSGNGDKKSLTFIADRSGKLFLYNNRTLTANFEADLENISHVLISKPGSGHFTAQIGPTEYLITYSWSSATGLVYVDASPINSLFNNANFFKYIVSLISIIFLLLGFALSYLISKRIYRPILRIVNHLENYKGTNIRAYKNELHLISNSIAEIVEESQWMSGRLEKKEKDLKQIYVQNLINGLLDNSKEEFQFPNQHFICLVVSIDMYHEFTRRYTYEEQYILKLLLLKGCEDIVQSHLNGMGAMLERDKFVFLLNPTNEQAGVLLKLLHTLYAEWEKEILTKYQLSLSLGIGNSYKGKENIKFSYLEALDAVKYKLLTGHNSIIAYSHLSGVHNNEFYYPIDREKHILNYLAAYKKEELFWELKELIEFLRTMGQFNYENIIQSIYQLVGNTIKYLVEENQKITEIFQGHNNLYSELAEKETLSEMNEWLVWFFETILDYRMKELSMNHRHIQDITDFIQQNFMKCDLTITTISETLGLSYPHLRKIFKNHIGVNVTDFIHNLRIKEAKRLLRDTEVTIKEISERIGYTNDQSFTRNFKKLEGITPGEFRNAVRESNEILSL